jgi:phage shock protein PspC (stress-responsive transcriptional regulator)
MKMSSKRLTRSRQHNIIAGVMGGIADYLGWSPFKVRLLFIIVSSVSAAVPGILVYLILWFLMPMAEE